MGASNHVGAIARLSESEGVFTTAQAKRMGIPGDALHDAVESGRFERIVRGAYRMVGSGSSFTDELAAIWKLTAPAKFSHERTRVPEWDGDGGLRTSREGGANMKYKSAAALAMAVKAAAAAGQKPKA